MRDRCHCYKQVLQWFWRQVFLKTRGTNIFIVCRWHSQYPDRQIPHISRFQRLPLHFLPFTFVSEHIPLVCKPSSALEPLSSNCSWNSVLFFTFYLLFLLLSFPSCVSYSLEKLSVGKKYYKFLHCKVTSFVKSI